MVTIGATVLGVGDVRRGMEFWMAALDYVPEREPDDDTWVILVPREGPGARLALDLSESAVQIHPRMHLDLWAVDQDAEVKRLIKLGAERVDWDLYPAEPDFVVLADPFGNRFCVVDASGSSS